MDLNAIFDNLRTLIQDNLLVSLAAAVLVGFMFYRKVKLALTFLLIGLVLAGAIFLITNLSTSGSVHKQRMTDISAAGEVLNK